MENTQKIGLVLSGGGARGAYQVGVLKGLSKISLKHNFNVKFDILCGVSAGSINASFLASYAHDFHEGVQQLENLWSNLTSEQVFASDAAHMGKLAVTWATELGFGALTGTTPGKALLDTSPLKRLLQKNLRAEFIQKNIEENHLYALALTSVDYQNSNSITFVHGQPQTPNWNKSRRISEKTLINSQHVLASSAIPLLFPAALVGNRWFGDGCVRNTHPCAPALYLGAQKLLVVGVRKHSFNDEVLDPQIHIADSNNPPSVAKVINMLLNAVLLDNIELDVERLQRVNDFIDRVPVEHQAGLNFRKVQFKMISPSGDIGQIAFSKSNRLPRIIRYLMKGLGRLEDAAEIISYLLFDPMFCKELIEMGHQDILKNEKEILELFQS